MHHGFVRVGPVFIVNGQSPEVLKPGEGAFDNPSFGKGDKFVRLLVRPEHDVQFATQQFSGHFPDGITSGSPRVSTTMCSFLPFIFLLPSIPL